ncbi:MAG: hypothetical protein ABI862_17400 [Ilumatobacteraceae bacterium]
MVLLAFDRGRLDSLRVAMGASLEELRSIRSSDYAAVDAMRMLAGACRTLSDTWLPRVHDVLYSTAMTSCTRSAAGVPDISQASLYAATHNHGWEVTTDPLPVYGPPAPRSVRSFEGVMDGIKSGELAPMIAPLDANGKAGAHYGSLSFTQGTATEIGSQDLTSNLAKIVDFFSDGLAVGWREHRTVTIYYLADARATSRVHVLSAYDRDDGPETLPEQTIEATTSGYLIVVEDEGSAEASMQIGFGDPTQSHSIIESSAGSYSGMFFPDVQPRFQPRTRETRVESPDQWTFTTSASPMTDEWGTWGI